jgi:hypothetical protein
VRSYDLLHNKQFCGRLIAAKSVDVNKINVWQHSVVNAAQVRTRYHKMRGRTDVIKSAMHASATLAPYLSKMSLASGLLKLFSSQRAMMYDEKYERMASRRKKANMCHREMPLTDSKDVATFADAVFASVAFQREKIYTTKKYSVSTSAP